MADLSQLFAPQLLPNQGSGTSQGFLGAQVRGAEFKRQTVMQEAMEQNLAPEDGDQFFEFVGKRLFQLGDVEGAMAVGQQRAAMLEGQAIAEQQAFENERALNKESIEFAKFEQDMKRTSKRLNLDERRVRMEELRFEGGAKGRELDDLIKQQELDNTIIDHDIKGVELEADRAQLKKTIQELDEVGLAGKWTPKTELGKKTLLNLYSGALAMRVLATDLRDYTPSDGVIAVIEQLQSKGDSPAGQIWNQITKRGGYRALTNKDKRWMSHALAIAEMTVRPVSGAAVPASEIAAAIQRFLPMPGNNDALRQEKLEARSMFWKGLFSTLPIEGQEQTKDELGVTDAMLMTDAEIDAIADNP